MSVRWCISEDWKTPAKGEEWHEAEDNLAAGEALSKRVNELWPGVFKMENCWHTMTEAGVIVDFGSHTFFGLIGKEEA